MGKWEEERSLLCHGKWVTPKALSKDIILPANCNHLPGDAEYRVSCENTLGLVWGSYDAVWLFSKSILTTVEKRDVKVDLHMSLSPGYNSRPVLLSLTFVFSSLLILTGVWLLPLVFSVAWLEKMSRSGKQMVKPQKGTRGDHLWQHLHFPDEETKAQIR